MQSPVKKRLAILLAASASMILGCAETPVESERVAASPPAEAQAAPAAIVSKEEFLGSALEGDLATIEAGLAGGVDVESATAEGSTALMLAAFNGHTDVVDTLLEHGSSVNQRDGIGRTALMYASSGPYADTVKLLVDKGAEVNLVDEHEKWTALMFAGGEGLTEVIEVLLSNGADAGLVDTDGDTALTFAERNGHEQAARLLRAAMQ
jgi:ankyrin repeat protein